MCQLLLNLINMREPGKLGQCSDKATDCSAGELWSYFRQGHEDCVFSETSWPTVGACS